MSDYHVALSVLLIMCLLILLLVRVNNGREKAIKRMEGNRNITAKEAFESSTCPQAMRTKAVVKYNKAKFEMWVEDAKNGIIRDIPASIL